MLNLILGVLYLILGLISSYFTYFMYSKYISKRGAKFLVALLVLFTITIFIDSIFLLLNYEFEKNIYESIFYFFQSFTIPLWVGFAVKYSGYSLKKPYIIIPIILLLILEFLFIVQHIIVIENIFINSLEVLSIIFQILIAFIGYVLIYNLYIKSRHNKRPILLVVIGGTLIPYILVIVFLELDIAYNFRPFWYIISGISFVHATKIGLFDVYGTYRGNIIDEIDDLLIVLNIDNKIIDYNDEAMNIFPNINHKLGESVDSIFTSKQKEIIFGSEDNNKIIINSKVYKVSIVEYENTVDTSIAILLKDITSIEKYQEQLKQINAELSLFSDALKHDLLNYIMIIQQYSELIEERQQIEPYNEKILSASKRSTEVINEMDKVFRNRIEKMEKEECDIKKVSTNVWDTLQTNDSELKIEDNFSVIADEGMLKSILENLFKNSIEHSDSKVTVSIKRNEDSIIIQDTGPGLSEIAKNNIFEHGFTESRENTGFGMTIIKVMVEMHGWEIDIDDSYTNGARFIIKNCEII